MKTKITLILCLISTILFSAERSHDWPKVRKQHLETQPTCQICGTMKSRQVHHIKPFHLSPDLEK